MDKLQPLINESFQLMLIGMFTVFIILIMLIFLITLVSYLLPAEEAEPLPATGSSAKQLITKSASTTDEQLIAVISAAISRFKK